ncbi:MAG: hypothetical protein WA840_15455 [Caulobacteraceae bacterium]
MSSLAIEPFRQQGGGVYDVFAVVEDQQDSTAGQEGQDIGERVLGLDEDAEDGGDGARDKRRVGDGAKIGEVHGVAERIEQGVGD